MIGEPPERPRTALDEAVSQAWAQTERTLAKLLHPSRVQSLSRPKAGTPPASTAVSVRFAIEGAHGIRFVMLTSSNAGAALASVLLGRASRPLDESARDALAEFANIATSSFLNGLSRALGLRLLPSPPALEVLADEEALRVLEQLRSQAYEATFELTLPAGSVRTVFVANVDGAGDDCPLTLEETTTSWTKDC